MKVKPGVKLRHFSAELDEGIRAVERTFNEHGVEAVLTSGYREGPWEQTLLHGIFRDERRKHREGKVDAVDFAYPPPELLERILLGIRARIGKQYGGKFDVLDEATSAAAQAAGVGSQWTGKHIHIEYDP